MDDLILQETAGPVRVLTLNRPQRHNSLAPALLAQLLAALENAAADTAVRALLLQANGRSFSTGGDVRSFYDHLDTVAEYAHTLVGLLNQVILALVRLPVPVITAVHGIVTGGSVGLVLASDEAVVTEQASFTPYYTVVGFSPDGGWTAMLPDVIGRRRTASALLHNQTITAQQAVDWGLAARIVPAERIRAEALAAAQDVAAKQPGAVQWSKRLLWPDETALAARLEAERAQFVQQIQTAEARRGMEAFLNASQ